MPPEQTDPTQVTKAPESGTTLGDQADLSGQIQDPPEGGDEKTVEQLEASNKRLKEQLKGREKEAETATSKLSEYEQSQRLAALQQPAPTTIYQQPPVNSQPQWSTDTFLTLDEEAEQEKAYEDLNSREIRRLDSLGRNRAIATAQGNLIQGLGQAAGIAQVQNATIADINSAPEWGDATVRQQLLIDTIETMRNPALAGRYAAGQWNVPGVGVINPNILLDKIKDHRIAVGGVVKAAKDKLKPEGHDALGGGGDPDSALPGAGDAFDASYLLTASERSLVQKGMGMKNTPFSKITETVDGYKKLWNGLNAEERARRKEGGAPNREGEKSRAGTIWRAKS